ncbi:MAG TPA: YqgE/AlgH family protein [Thermoanaerobaculia bacterium]|nr:YqgE/AlgH family protein [Thermoanaerobaculia bacterium]
MSSAGSELTAPVLLLAMPQVLDPFFHRSVVLLAHHEEGGSFGFIVNRPTGIKVSEILSGMEVSWRGRDEAVAYFGGPVQPQLGTVLWTPDGDASLGDTASWILPGVAITQHIGDLSALAERPPDRLRLILGYAGWGAGQLLDEILRNDWLTAPVDSDLLFAPDPERIWSDALRSVGVDPAALPSWPSAGGGEETTN